MARFPLSYVFINCYTIQSQVTYKNNNNNPQTFGHYYVTTAKPRDPTNLRSVSATSPRFPPPQFCQLWRKSLRYLENSTAVRIPIKRKVEALFNFLPVHLCISYPLYVMASLYTTWHHYPCHSTIIHVTAPLCTSQLHFARHDAPIHVTAPLPMQQHHYTRHSTTLHVTAPIYTSWHHCVCVGATPCHDGFQ